jgi:hypothetical protein
MKLQSAFGKALRKRFLQFLCLPLTVAMAENIIGITLERDARMISSHPHVERIVEKEIRQ